MNQCESIRELLSEMIDSELPDARLQSVESHLAECASCRDELRELSQLDRKLANVLVIDAVQEKIRRVSESSSAAKIDNHARRPTKSRIHWIGIVAAVAASLLLGFFVWPPNQMTPTLGTEIAAKLVSATGPVEILAAGNAQWQTIVPPNTMEIGIGSRIRTANSALCEIQTTSQGKVRMDGDCEVVFNDSRKLELVAGRLWCNAPADAALEVNVPIESKQSPTIATLTCPTKSSFQCEATPSSVSCSTPLDQDPKELAQFQVGKEKWQINPGQTVSINSSQQLTREPRNEAIDVWQLPLLAISANSRPELSDYLQKLLAPIGRSKARHMNEMQIRALGPAGALPLLSFVIHEPSGDQHLRKTAMRLANETADESTIPMLQQLTEDHDPWIASQAINLLERLEKNGQLP